MADRENTSPSLITNLRRERFSALVNSLTLDGINPIIEGHQYLKRRATSLMVEGTLLYSASLIGIRLTQQVTPPPELTTGLVVAATIGALRGLRGAYLRAAAMEGIQITFNHVTKMVVQRAPDKLK